MKTKILKILGVVILSGFFTSLNAKTPNEWTSSQDSVYGDSYTILNKEGLNLEISCTTDFSGGDEHSILFYRAYKEILNRSKEDKAEFETTHSFKFDGKPYPFPPRHTRVRADADAWSDFRSNISKARKIELLKKRKVVATFYPSLASLDVVSDVNKSSACRAIMDQRY